MSVSRNRLQGFIALLPLVDDFIACAKSLAVLIFIIYQGVSAVMFDGAFLPTAFYFLLHLVMAGILLLHSVNNGNSVITACSFLFFMAASLAVWAMFIYG